MPLTSGTQGLQLALLAPGWDTRMPRAVVPVAPLCAGVAHEARTACIRSPVAAVIRGRFCPDDARRRDEEFVAPHFAHQLALNAWRHDFVAVYLTLIVGAFVAGLLRNRLELRRP